MENNTGPKSDKDIFINKSADELYKLWLRRTSLWGALTFMLLSVQDFVSSPENFVRFLYYRTVIALLLVTVSVFVKKFNDMPIMFHRAAGLLAVMSSAVAIELMIMGLGGHRSSYYVGQILLLIVVIGFIPADFLMHLVFAVGIYAIYFVPIMIFDKITDLRTFLTSNIFILSVVISLLVLRYLSWKSLVEELALKYDFSRDFEKLRLTEHALRESQVGLSRAQQIAHIGDWEWDIATNKVFWSDELYRIYGFALQEIAPDYGLITGAMHPKSRDEFFSAIDAALKGERLFEMDYTFFRKDGSTAILHTIGQVIYDAEGGPVRMLGTVQDITEQKRVEEALLESEEKFRNIFDNANDGILIASMSSRKFVEANKSMCLMLGYTKEEIKTLGIEDIHPPKDVPRVLAEFENQRRGKKVIAESLPVRRKDGSIFYADIGAAFLTLGGGQYAVGIFRDITERKKVVESSQQSETRMRMAMAAARQGFFKIDITTDNVVVSPSYARMMGYEPEEFPPRWFDLIHPDDCDDARLIYDEYINGRRDDCRSEFRQQAKSGQWRWISSVGAVVEWDNDGTPTRMFGIYTDITERKEAEEALRNSEQFIRKILDTVDEGFIVVDRDFHIMTANRAYCSQVGESCDAVIGRHCFEISHKTLRPCFEEGEECAVRHVFETGEPYTALHSHPEDKGILYVETKAFPIKDSTGAVISVIETVNNITEKHLLEEERLKTQKLEAIGTLAGGIAHDFNNLLQGIFGYITMAKMTLDHKDRALAMLDQAEKALHLSVNLTTQLLTFSKGGKPIKKNISLGPVIENSVRFALSGSSADSRITLAEDLWVVDADEGQIGQVVQNIVLNADQAMPLGGTIVIIAKNVLSSDKGLPQLQGKGRYVEISVQDSGIGISEKYLEKIFDPYFTTKEKGSGLGLATSYSIIRNHGGLIDVKSGVGNGTTFYIYLPAVELEAETMTVPTVSFVGRRGKILIMDDEELIRNIAGTQVKVLGNEVEVAENGETAIAKYTSAMETGKPFDIVILDLTVRGGMGGRETIERLLAIDPGVRAIVSSGYSDNDVVADYQKYGFRASLSKPYRLVDLRDTLNALLSG